MKKIVKMIFKTLIISITLIGILFSVYILSEYTKFRKFKESNKWEEKIKEAKDDEFYANFDELPKRYIDAVVSVEDRRFYQHNGIDLRSIGRAIKNNFRTKELVEGGSTITQQLAKNIFFTQETSFSRKINEVFASLELEKEFSKDEIFELYVNNSYFGSGYYSIKEAALGYYGKELDELDLNEMTFLAGVPNAPSVYDPRENPDLAKQRQIQVLKRMKSNKKITLDEYKKVYKQKIEVIEER